MDKNLIDSEESAEQKAKRLVNKLRNFIYSDVMVSLCKFDNCNVETLLNLYDEFDYIFNKKIFNMCLNYQDALKLFSDFFKDRIINCFCFHSNSKVYEDVIRIIALFCRKNGIL